MHIIFQFTWIYLTEDMQQKHSREASLRVKIASPPEDVSAFSIQIIPDELNEPHTQLHQYLKNTWCAISFVGRFSELYTFLSVTFGFSRKHFKFHVKFISRNITFYTAMHDASCQILRIISQNMNMQQYTYVCRMQTAVTIQYCLIHNTLGLAYLAIIGIHYLFSADQNLYGSKSVSFSPYGKNKTEVQKRRI